MYKFHDVLQDSSGNVITSGDVTVEVSSSGAAATIYQDDETTVISQPFSPDAEGNISFKVENGVYDILVNGSVEKNNVAAFDPSDAPSAAVTLGVSSYISSITNLKAETNITNGRTILLTQSGREGVFVFDNSNLSTEVTADTQNGVYVPPNSDTTGASGAWVRQHNGTVEFPWFGASTSATVSANTTAIQAALDFGAKRVTYDDNTYTVNGLTISSALTLDGQGLGGEIKFADSATGSYLLEVTANNVNIINGKFDGNRANNTSKNIIHVTGDNCVIRNNKIHDGSNIGVVLYGSSNSKIEDNDIYDCVFQHVLTNAAGGAITDISICRNRIYATAFGINTNNGGIGNNAATNSITRLTVNNNILNFPVSTSAPAAQVLITTYGNVNEYTIENNICYGGRIGISNGGAHHGVCKGNQVFQPYEIGIEVATGGAYDSYNVIVSGNEVSGSDSGGTTNTKGIACTSSAAISSVTKVLVSDNHVTDCFIPIQVSETSSGAMSDICLRDNYVIMSSTSGRIDIQNIENLSVKGNQVDLNSKTTAAGIKLTDCDVFDVSDNFIYNSISGATGILLVGSSVDITHGAVKNNNFEGAGTCLSMSGYIRYTGDSNTVDITGPLEISGNVGQTYPTRASGDGNPSVAQAEAMYLSGSSSITDLIHGYVGKEITIRSTGTPTITNGTPILLNGSANFVMASGDNIRLKMITSGVWEEISRMVR